MRANLWNCFSGFSQISESVLFLNHYNIIPILYLSSYIIPIFFCFVRASWKPEKRWIILWVAATQVLVYAYSYLITWYSKNALGRTYYTLLKIKHVGNYFITRSRYMTKPINLRYLYWQSLECLDLGKVKIPNFEFCQVLFFFIFLNAF